MATKLELEARVRDLEWALYHIHTHVEEARKAYKNLGFGDAGELPMEQQPYYVVGAINSRIEMIAGDAVRAVPNLLLVEA